MTQEWILKMLLDFGFKQQDAEVYIFLALNGPQKVKDIVSALNTYKRRVYRSLRQLQAKEIVKATSKSPAQFSAISFDKVLDIFAEANIEEAKRIEQKKDYLIALWKSSIEGN